MGACPVNDRRNGAGKDSRRHGTRLEWAERRSNGPIPSSQTHPDSLGPVMKTTVSFHGHPQAGVAAWLRGNRLCLEEAGSRCRKMAPPRPARAIQRQISCQCDGYRLPGHVVGLPPKSTFDALPDPRNRPCPGGSAVSSKIVVQRRKGRRSIPCGLPRAFPTTCPCRRRRRRNRRRASISPGEGRRPVGTASIPETFPGSLVCLSCARRLSPVFSAPGRIYLLLGDRLRRNCPP